MRPPKNPDHLRGKVTRTLSVVGPYAILAATLGFGSLLLEAPQRGGAANWVTFVGMALLAAPAIRLNEQGRLISRIRSLMAAIETQERESRTKDIEEGRRRTL